MKKKTASKSSSQYGEEEKSIIDYICNDKQVAYRLGPILSQYSNYCSEANFCIDVKNKNASCTILLSRKN